MFNLERLERRIVIVLISALVLALAIIFYKKTHSSVEINIRNFEIGDIEGSIAEARIVNINTADMEELMRLKGIGKVTAGRIIDYRTRMGRFRSREEIKNVEGIGDKLFEGIEDSIEIE